MLTKEKEEAFDNGHDLATSNMSAQMDKQQETYEALLEQTRLAGTGY